jgi:SagB-type dehydrogenase family enzyme
MNEPLNLGSAEGLDRRLFSVSEIFHENSKLRRASDGRMIGPGVKGLQPNELAYAESHGSKMYRCAPTVPLADGLPMLAVPLEQALRSRRSIRDYSGEAVAFASLSRILDLSYGVSDAGTVFARRTAPSAGALYTNDLYAVALNVDGLEPGLYHYQPAARSVERLRQGDLRREVADAVLYPEVVVNAAAIFVIAAVFQRARVKYGERGYRYAFLDAGHIAQNIYLVSTALGLGALALGGFLDDQMSDLVDMNGVDEAVVYVVTVGRPSAEDPLSARSHAGE